MNNVLVYAVAEKYDIPDLKELAKRKFQILAGSKWPYDDFHAVTEVVFSTTHDGDMGLRQIVLDLCKDHFRQILKDEEFRAGFLDNKAIAIVVSKAATRKLDQDQMMLDVARATQRSLEMELSKAKADAKAALDQKEAWEWRAKAGTKEALEQKDAWESRLNSIVQNAYHIDSCRHCRADFNCFFEWSSENPAWLAMQLRCAECRTRHPL